MELKKVVSDSEIEYATKQEVSEKKLKRYIPTKWKKYGITGTFFSLMMKSKVLLAVSTTIDPNDFQIMGDVAEMPPELVRLPLLNAVLDSLGILMFAVCPIFAIVYYIKKKKGSENLKKLKIATIICLCLGIIAVILSHVLFWIL